LSNDSNGISVPAQTVPLRQFVRCLCGGREENPEVKNKSPDGFYVMSGRPGGLMALPN